MSELLHRRYDLPDGRDFKSIVVRETGGRDEILAAKQFDSRPDHTTMEIELVRNSIVFVDGKSVIRPFMDLDDWSSQSRNYVAAAYNALNALPEEQVAVFLATGEDVSPAAATLAEEPADPVTVKQGRRTRNIAK